MNGLPTMTPVITPRQFIAALGVLAAAIGLFALVLPVSADYAGSLLGNDTIACGTPANPNTPAGLGGAACREALNDRRIWAIPVGLLGMIAAIGAFTVYRRRESTEDN